MSNAPEHLRPIEAVYLYNSYDGDLLIYDVTKLQAVIGPRTWIMNSSNDKHAPRIRI